MVNEVVGFSQITGRQRDARPRDSDQATVAERGDVVQRDSVG